MITLTERAAEKVKALLEREGSPAACGCGESFGV